MVQLHDLYNNGMSFEQYIGSASNEDKEKHLYYLQKMMLTEKEKTFVLDIQADKNLLVFSDLFCPDCRVTLTLLENMKQVNSRIDYKILSRKGHEGIMKQVSGTARIPLIIDFSKDKAQVLYNEYPLKVQKEMESTPSKEDIIRLEYRKGFYKAEMIQQLL